MKACAQSWYFWTSAQNLTQWTIAFLKQTRVLGGDIGHSQGRTGHWGYRGNPRWADGVDTCDALSGQLAVYWVGRSDSNSRATFFPQAGLGTALERFASYLSNWKFCMSVNNYVCKVWHAAGISFGGYFIFIVYTSPWEHNSQAQCLI